MSCIISKAALGIEWKMKIILIIVDLKGLRS